MKLKAALMCHAPIVINLIAGPEAAKCERSTQAMVAAAEFLVKNKPDGLVVLSPHTPRYKEAFGVVGGELLQGDFGAFGHAELGTSIASHIELSNYLIDHCQVGELQDVALDHGALVPLHFLEQAGWNGKTVVISFPYNPSHSECRRFGRLLSETLPKFGSHWGICASGDMSHRLIPGAPSGFHPDARQFDEHVATCVEGGDYLAAVSVDDNLRELAAEDVIDSLEIATSMTNFSSDGGSFYSYEGPFGVGYLVSALYETNL